MAGRALHLTEALVARVERQEPEYPGRRGLPWMEDEGYARHAARLLDEAGEGPVWTFAYGSLIWKPAFAPAAAVPAVLHGWRRSFCIHLESWRGTPEEPGLMLALQRGGACVGVAYRMPTDDPQARMLRLLKREIDFHESVRWLRWVTVRAPEGSVRALAFYCAPEGGPGVAHLTPEAQARRLARAAGHVGSCAEYLYNTVSHLEALGIRDRYLWDLQARVAAEIDRL